MNEKWPNNLSKLRETKNKTQTELANFLGTSRQAVSLYEKGQRVPNLETQLKMATYFDVSIYDLNNSDDLGTRLAKSVIESLKDEHLTQSQGMLLYRSYMLIDKLGNEEPILSDVFDKFLTQLTHLVYQDGISNYDDTLATVTLFLKAISGKEL